MKWKIRLTSKPVCLLAMLFGTGLALPLLAHHSAAGYSLETIEVMTGAVERVYPAAGHLEIYFKPLNALRDDYLRDSEGTPIIWSVEMAGASASAGEGISTRTFPPGTVFSIALHPRTNGKPAGLRVRGAAVFRCTGKQLPDAGRHCDSVVGHIQAGAGALPAAGS